MDHDFNHLQLLTKYRTTPAYIPTHLGEEAIELFNNDIRKRYSKFGKLAEVWNTLVPEMFQEHTFLASFVRGTLCVHVDSSSHLYELRQLLSAGLGEQIILAARGEGLRKITLKRGKLCD